MAEAFATRAGQPEAERPGVPVSSRVPADVLDADKAGEPGWQTRMNDALAAGFVSNDERERSGHEQAKAPAVAPRSITRMA